MQTRQPNYLPWYPFSPPCCILPRTLPNSFYYYHTDYILSVYLPLPPTPRSTLQGSRLGGLSTLVTLDESHSQSVLLPSPPLLLLSTDRYTTETQCTPSTPTCPPVTWEARPVKPPRRTQPASPGTAHDSSPGVGTQHGVQVGAVTVLWNLLPLGAGSWLISAVPSTAWCA